MLVKELMTREIGACTLNDTAEKAAAIMTKRNCGFVPVVLDHTSNILVGVLTDRDLALFLGQTDRRASEVQVEEFCRRFPKTAMEDANIREIEEMMRECQIHRVPIVDKNGKLKGVVSLKDLADEAWRDSSDFEPEVAEKDIAEIVESISR